MVIALKNSTSLKQLKNIITTREAARNQFDFKSILSSEGLNIGKTDKEFMRKCLACFLSSISTYSQWPQWRGPMRDGISKEENLLKVLPSAGPKLVWSVDTVGDGFSSTAIQDQMVYTTGKQDSVEILTALDLKGNIKWQKVFGRASQEKEWPQGGIAESPLIVDDKMIITPCGNTTTMVALKRFTSGKVYLFKMNENNIELVSSFRITAGSGPRIAHMSISNGLLFIRHGKVLMAYDLKQRS